MQQVLKRMIRDCKSFECDRKHGHSLTANERYAAYTYHISTSLLLWRLPTHSMHTHKHTSEYHWLECSVG